MKSLLLTLGFVALAMLLLSVRVILRKNGRFSSQHLGDNPAMRKRNIGCVVSEDYKARKAAEKKLDIKHL
ncbi:MAG: hypothetical protein MJZ88_01370 [Paludibacteraceae bacterium]|nr:hypothetical protein [Candidatus Colicola coprequi]MCQ2333244.1 hypothetical protein [Paludibacteraceae bacterium]